MAALILSVSFGLAAAHWLLRPLTAVLAPLVELQLLPWLLLVLGLWLLAGQRGPQA